MLMKEGNTLSSFEIVLPANVVETCYVLRPEEGTEFLATNVAKRTTTRMKLKKQIDSSVRIQLTVHSLIEADSMQPENVKIEDAVLWSNEQIIQAETFQSIQEATLIEDSPLSTPSQSTDAERHVLHEDGNSFDRTSAADDKHERIVDSVEVCSSVDAKVLSIEPPNEPHFKDAAASQPAPVNVEPMESAGDRPDHCLQWNQPYSDADSNDISPDHEEAPLTIAEKVDVPSASDSEAVTKKQSMGSEDALLIGKEQLVEKEMNKGQTFEEDLCEEDKKKTKESLDEVSSVTCNEKHLETHEKVSVSKLPQNSLHNKGLPNVVRIIKNEPVDTVEETNIRKTALVRPTEKFDPVSKKALAEMLVELGSGVDTKNGVAEEQPCVNRPRRLRTHACSFCMVKCADVGALYKHMKKYHSKKKGIEEILEKLKEQKRVTCGDCGRHLGSYRLLQQHCKQMHCSIGSMQCPHCNKTLKSQYYLKSHIWRLHSNPSRRYLCHLCPASFKVQGYLSEHLKHVHSSNTKDSYKCSLCSYTCMTEKYLHNHKLRVHQGQQHKCSECEKSFSVAANLRRHVQLVHTKSAESHVCPECGNTFSLKSNLKEHVNSVHLRKFSFVCKFCGEGFRRKKEVDAHLEIHEKFSGMEITLTKEKKTRSRAKVAQQKARKPALFQVQKALAPKETAQVSEHPLPPTIQVANRNNIHFAVLSHHDLARLLPADGSVDMIQMNNDGEVELPFALESAVQEVALGKPQQDDGGRATSVQYLVVEPGSVTVSQVEVATEQSQNEMHEATDQV